MTKVAIIDLEEDDGLYIGYLEGEIDIHAEKCERCQSGEACAFFDTLRNESIKTRGNVAAASAGAGRNQ